MNSKNQIKGAFMLLLTAFIWGISFVAQSVGMKSVQAFTYGAVRTLLGALVLLPVVIIRDKRALKSMDIHDAKKRNKKALYCGAALGVVFCIATNFQQFAFCFPDASAGKIAFLTAVYMFLVPIIGAIFLKKRYSFITWLCVVVGFVGLYFLCTSADQMRFISTGDFLSLICAVFFAIHILLIEKFTSDCDGIKLSFIQFLVSGIITLVLMFIFEQPDLEAIKNAAVPILYSGVLCCGVAYTFQIIGQKHTEATLASIIMCTESVFAVLSSAVILGEIPTVREFIGCVMMFAAAVVSELSGNRKPNKRYFFKNIRDKKR